tara:strand:- start:547 stop:1182 length:636 start_codon:yes stop_codon:yes gene_type:complete
MKKYIFLLCITPLISISQSGISLSGSSQFYTGQSIIPLSSGNFYPVNLKSRNHQITLSIFRGKKFKIGTFAINASLSYSINNVRYSMEEEVAIDDYETTQISIMPKVGLWHIIFQKQNIFIYTSVGGFAVIEDLNIISPENKETPYEYNVMIPFFRTGIQLNYGKFFINPFISFDLQEIDFVELKNIGDLNLKEKLTNYTIRSGLEFGIMF